MRLVRSVVIAERSSQFADAFEQTVVADMDVRPDRLHQFLLAEDPAGVGDEQRQHREVLRTKLGGFVVGPAQFESLRIQFKAGKTEHIASRGT